MRTWPRRILRVTALLVGVVVLLSVVGFRMFRSSPTWYQRPASTPEQREALARAAENKLIHAQNWAAELRADAERAQRPGAVTTAATTAPAVAPRATTRHVLSVSEGEINALFDKWSKAYGWDRKYAEQLRDPSVALRDGRLILGGMLNEVGAVVSFQFAPRVDAQGKLHIELARVSGGRLPLPQAVWTPYRDRLARSVRDHLPRWRATARIDPSGAANGALMSATLGELFLNVAANAPAEPVLFLPLAGRGESVPVRVRDVKVAQGELEMVVEPLAPAEREALLQRIRSPLQRAQPSAAAAAPVDP